MTDDLICMWSVQFWQNGTMQAFNKHWGTKKKAKKFARQCIAKNLELKNLELKIKAL